MRGAAAEPEAAHGAEPFALRRSLLDRLLDRVALMAVVSAALSVAITYVLSWLLGGGPPGWVGLSIALIAGSSIALVLGTQRSRSLQRLAAAHAEIREQLAEVERLRAQLERMAQRDPLTGLLNRRGLDEAFERERARCERAHAPLTVIVVDLDAFKEVNDRHGHLIGDRAIAAAAALLAGVVRSSDPVARFGGDEFVIVLPEHDALAAQEVVTRMRSALATDATLHALGVDGLSASFGAAQAPQHGRDLDRLLHVADQAMYGAKARKYHAAPHAADD